jgi:hypothetical protein
LPGFCTRAIYCTFVDHANVTMEVLAKVDPGARGFEWRRPEPGAWLDRVSRASRERG